MDLRSRPTWLVAVAVDVAAVLLFAVAGRRSHDESSGVTAILTVAAPFLLGLLVGWILVVVLRRDPWSIPAGVGVWLATVVIGLLLRRMLWDRGVAASFVVVATAVLGALLIGWRALLWFALQRREIRSASPPPGAGL